MNDIPAWPSKLTREQQRTVRQRNKEFQAALKRNARANEWRYAGGLIFRQSVDWFMDILPSLLWEHGLIARLRIKPMALDPLFWDIVGLPENNALPISFRAMGAWVLRPKTKDEYIGLDINDVETLATDLFRWANDRADTILADMSLGKMLDDLPPDEDLRGQTRALATCLRIMNGDLDRAMRLCNVDEPDVHPLVRDGGGFTTRQLDGSYINFLDQAIDWIENKITDKRVI